MRSRGERPNHASDGDWSASEGAGEETPVISPLAGAERVARASQWRWGLRLGALVAVVALVVTVAVTLAPVIPYRPTPQTPPDYIALELPPELRFCATNGYWSPDGRRIAVARAPLCGPGVEGMNSPPDIYLFDASNGAQITEYTIMPAIQDALAQAGLSGAQVNYSGVTWSPDQRTLAAQFDVVQSLPQGASERYIRARAGVALVALAGPHPGAVSALISARGLSRMAEGSGYTPGPLAVDEWDTRQLTSRQLNLPVSLGYEWLPGDLLVGAAPPPSGGAGATPALTDSAWLAGNTAGGQRFSMWRTGYFVAVNAVDCERSGANAPAKPYTPLIALYLSTTAWSPDGRYLLMVNQIARAPQALILNANAPLLPFCLPESAASAFPQAPIHDRAMRAALGLLGGAVTDVELLWSSDGARLVALPTETSQASNMITLYDTATGNILARISAGPSQIPGAQGSDANALFINGAWSPDGRRILTVVEGQQFNIRIYSPRALG